MERQYQADQNKWMTSVSDELIFSRWGDDNQVYFMNPENQVSMGLQMAPVCNGAITGECPTQVPPETRVCGQSAVFELCDDVPSYRIQLESGGTAVVFLDAWEPWQTVPVLAHIYSSPGNGRWAWHFTNYVPIFGPTSNSGQHDSIVRTFGNTNRTPTGEYPVSAEAREKRMFHVSERPTWTLKHLGGPPVRADIRIKTD